MDSEGPPPRSRSRPVPVVVGIEWLAVAAAAHHPARLLESLLGRVMAKLAERLPVFRVPEQLPRGLDAQWIRTGFGVLQSWRDLVVNNDRGHGPRFGRTHAAEGMFTKESIPRLLPAISITSLCTADVAFTAHADCSAEPRRFRLSSPAIERTTRLPHRHRDRPQHFRSQPQS